MRLRDSVQHVAQVTIGNALVSYERIRRGAAYSPFDKRLYSDPYPLYQKLRERDPVHRSWLMGGWVLTRYEDVLDVFRDPRYSADESNAPGYEKMVARARKQELLGPDEEITTSMLRSDPPDHTRLRQLVSKAFTPRAVSSLAPRIEKIVEEHLDAVVASGQMDVIEDLAYPLPVIVIAEMIGVPREDQERFKHWSNEVVRGLGFSSIADARASRKAGLELREYFKGIAEQRRAEPRDDLMSGLLAAEEEGDRLTSDEVMGVLELLLVAGNETTTNLIGNGALALLRNPEQLAELARDPSLIDVAIEELLRYDGPVQATSRIATEDMEIDGTPIRRGQNTILVLGAANHDPERFPNPDRLDFEREDRTHLAFGHGVHFCLGSTLARLEARYAIAALAERFPNLKLATEQPRWRRNLILRGMESLPVRF